MQRFFLIFAYFFLFIFPVGVFAQSEAVYLSFGQRLILSYVLEAAGQAPEVQSEIAERASKVLSRLRATPPQWIKVTSFEEFMQIWRGDWPETHSLSLDLELIEKRADLSWRRCYSDDPLLGQQIQSYYLSQTSLLLNYLGITDALSKEPRLLQLLQGSLAILNYFSGPLLGLNEISASKLKEFFSVLEPRILEKMNGVERVVEQVTSEGLDVAGGHLTQRVIRLFVVGYFKNLGLSSKKQVANLMLGLPIGARPLEKFGAAIGAAGPQLQKLLQILAREKSLDTKLRNVFRELESNVRRVPWTLVSEILEDEKKNFEFQTVDHDPLGVGSMAQVHRGFMVWKGVVRKVAIRFLKPGIEERVREDREILRRLAPVIDSDEILSRANLPKMTPIVDELSRTIEAELNQEETARRQALGHQVYKSMDKKTFKSHGLVLEVGVPEVFVPAGGKTRLMVQEFVDGKKLDEVAKYLEKEIPDLKVKIIEQLARVWVKVVVFGLGLYHADLHQGNFVIDVGNKKIRLSILDFGMSGNLSPQLQDNFIKLGTALKLLNPKAIGAAFWALSDKTKNVITLGKLVEVLTQEVHRLSPQEVANRHLHEWVALVMENGLALNYDFVNLNRGYLILSRMMEESGSSYDLSMIAKEVNWHKIVRIAKIFNGDKDLSLLDFLRLATQELFSKIVPKVDGDPEGAVVANADLELEVDVDVHSQKGPVNLGAIQAVNDFTPKQSYRLTSKPTNYESVKDWINSVSTIMQKPGPTGRQQCLEVLSHGL